MRGKWEVEKRIVTYRRGWRIPQWPKTHLTLVLTENRTKTAVFEKPTTQPTSVYHTPKKLEAGENY